ncbi:MAG: GNAT family N-acetyltransferase [Oscillospiraceae bacterium]|nr:GNAT family N-acetyltransferase [Oscillospiraceae bacterium]
MNIIYNETKKDLPVEQLCHLFNVVGWGSSRETTPKDWLENFNRVFITSTLVVSAWENERLVGAVRVLSDKFFRSIIYDLVIDPEYQNKGIGRELVKRCIAHYPNSEWSLETTEKNIGFYEKIGFKRSKGVHFRIPGKYQPE